MIIGYARVSTKEQSLDPQIDELKKAGCKKIYTDVISGVKKNRPGFDELLHYARENDVLIVVRLDRLGRSMKDLIATVEILQSKKINFKSLNENIDTSTATGKLTLNLFSALADFERNLIIERTKSGLKAARARGKLGGRKPVLNKEKIKQLVTLYDSGKFSITEICNQFKISRPTLYKYVKKNKIETIANIKAVEQKMSKQSLF